jgi:outer membrane immunogenic protein
MQAGQGMSAERTLPHRPVASWSAPYCAADLTYRQGIFMKSVIFAAIAAASLSTTAFAQDDAAFAGGRAEVVTGYDALDSNSNGLGTLDGVLYGVALGYDIQHGNIVLGFEGEIADSTGKAFGVETDRDIYLGARLGTVIGGSALAYVKAGYTNAAIDIPGFGSETGSGIRAGAGVEYKLGGQLFVKGEYRYSNYEGDVERHQIVGGLGIRF